MNKWKEVGRWKVGTPDGHSEELILERSKDNGYRLKNDFGNVDIEMDETSAAEFFKKALKCIDDSIIHDMDDWLNDTDNLFTDDEDTDCDSSWGAD